MISVEMTLKLLKHIDSNDKIIKEAKGAYQRERNLITNVKKAVKNGRESYNRS